MKADQTNELKKLTAELAMLAGAVTAKSSDPKKPSQYCQSLSSEQPK
jgi:hypothetical protein